MSDLFQVFSDHPIEVTLLGGSSVTVAVQAGSGTVYYADSLPVSSAVNQGSITAGNSATFTKGTWLVSASSSAVQITRPAAGQDVVPGTVAPTTVYVAAFGAKGDVKNVSDGAITTGTAALTSATANFAPADQGKIIVVAGAGTNVTPTGTTASASNQITSMSALTGISPGMLITGAGIPAATMVQAIISATVIQISQNATASASVTLTISGQLSSTIQAVTSSTAVTLAANAGTTVSSAFVAWGTDDSTAITNAVAAFNAQGRGILRFEGGDYFCGGGYTITGAGTVAGAGPGASSYSTTLILKPGANADMFTLNPKLATIRDLGLDGNYLGQTGTSRGIVVTSAYARLESLFINNMNGDGIAFTTAASVGGHTTNVEIRNCQGYGVNISHAQAWDNDWTSVNIGSSGKSGMLIAAPDQACTLLHSWGNGTLGTANDGSGIKFSGGIGACRFGTCYLETNFDRGIYAANSGNSGHTITNTLIWKNRNQGVYMFSARWITFTGNTIYDNGQNGGNGQGSSGIVNDTGTGWTVQGNTFFDDQSTKTQTWAYFELNTVTASVITGNVMRASDHKTGSTTLTGATNVPAAIPTGNTHTTTTVDGMTSTTGIQVGMAVTGSGVQGGTTVASVVSNVSITLSLATTSTLTGTPLTIAAAMGSVNAI